MTAARRRAGVASRAASPQPLAATEGLAFLGLRIARDRNQSAAGDLDLTASDATVRSVVVRAREDLEIARQVSSVIDEIGQDDARVPTS